MRWRTRLIAACASVVMAIAGLALASVNAHAALSCQLDLSAFPVGHLFTFSMAAQASGCAPAGFSGFTQMNGINTVSAAPPFTAVGYIANGTDYVPTPTTVTSVDGHAQVTFNQPNVVGGNDFDTMQMTVVSTDGSSSAVFSQFFCDSDGNFTIDAQCTLTLLLPPPAAPTATVSANPTAIVVGGTSTLTFTLTNPNSGVGLSGVMDSVTLPAGVAVASTSNASSNCGGTFTPAAPLTVSGGSLTAGGNCTFQVDVTATTSGAKMIPTGAPRSTESGLGVVGTPATLTVNPLLTTNQAVPSTTLTVGSMATPFTPVTAAGGTGTLSYALSSAGGPLPMGLTFQTTTGQISGTPSTTLTLTTFTVTVTDQNTPVAQTSSKTFNLTVNPALTTTQAVPSTILTVGSAATPFTPVTASPGTGTLSYALSGGTLPMGLSFMTSTGQISGTPSTTLTLTTFTVTVTDQTTPTPQMSAKTFNLTVNSALTTTQAVPSTILTVGSAATPFTPVTASPGTGTLSYALSGGTLPMGLSFMTSTGQISGMPSTALTLTTFTVTVTDQTTPTPQMSAKTFNLTVNGQLTTTQAVPSTTLTVGSAATPFTPVTASPGTGTLSYALSGGTLPMGLSFMTSTGQISGTPSTTLTLTTFTVTVTDQTTPTPQMSAKTFNLTVNGQLTTTQAMPSTTLTVGSAATPFTPVTASGGTGTLSYALSGATLPAGLNFMTSTGQISGTPTATLTMMTFTVTVTDQTTPTPQMSAMTFSLTVNGPLTTTQAMPSTTLTVGSMATPFTPVTAMGGTGTLSYALSGATLPAGLNFMTSTGQISGTPTATLTMMTFTVTVTDQTTPTPQMSAKTFNLTVNGQLTTMQSVPSTTLAAGSVVTPFIPVTALGGTGTLSYALSSAGGPLPMGLTFQTTTGQISGTPSTTLTLTTFTVTVTDQTTPTPQTSSKTFSLTVTAPLFSFTPPAGALPGGVAGSSYSRTIAASGGTTPYTFAIFSGALPSGLVLNASTGVISGTLATAGSFSFTVSIRDANNQTGTAAYTLNIAVPAVTAMSSTATTVSGAAVTVDLTAGATGGPFTSAQLLSLSPASAGSALITLGDTASNSDMVVAALVTGGKFLVKFTPGPTFSGTAMATFTLSTAFATSSSATVTFTVNPRPDPSRNSEVIGLVNAQAQAARHFASSQITNFNDRLEALHDGDCHQNSFRLGLSDGRPVETDPLQRIGLDRTKGHFGSNNAGSFDTASNDRGSNHVSSNNGVSRRDAAARKREASDAVSKECDAAAQRFAAWTGGYVSLGKLNTGASSGINYLTAGLSAGIDYWFSPAFTGGFGIGFGNDKSTIGINGTISNAFSYNAALYGSWHPSRDTFVDMVIGYGIMAFDSSRYITGTAGEFAAGSRNGHQFFGSVTSGYQYKASGFLISPYGRLGASWSTLGSFTETGGGVFALQYGNQTIGSLTGGFGLRAAYDFREAWGVVTPRMRIEYAHEFAGGSMASIAYADLVGISGTYSLPITPTGSDYVTAGLGTDFSFLSGWILSIDYRTTAGQEKVFPQTLNLKLGTKF